MSSKVKWFRPLTLVGFLCLALVYTPPGFAEVRNTPHDFSKLHRAPCFQCHNMHGTQTSPMDGTDWNDEFAYANTGKRPIEALVCFACHDNDGNIPGDWQFEPQHYPIENDFGNPYAVPSAVQGKKYTHKIDFVENPLYRCTGCHDQHGVKDPLDTNITDGLDILPKLLLVNNAVKEDSTQQYTKGARFCFACHDLVPVSAGGLFQPPEGYHDASSPDLMNNETRKISDGPDGIPDNWIRNGTYGPVSKRRNSAFFFASKHNYLERRQDHDSDQDGVPDNPYYNAFGGWSNDIPCLICHRVHGSDMENLIRDNTDAASCAAASCHPTTPPPSAINKEADLCLQCHSTPATYPYTVGPGTPATYITEGHRADKSKFTTGHGSVPFKVRFKDAPPFDTSFETTWVGLDCGDCHDQHGTGQYKMVLSKAYDVHTDVYDTTTGERLHNYSSSLRTTNVGVDGNQIRYICFACHTNPAYATYDMAGNPDPSSTAYYNGRAYYEASAHSGVENRTAISDTADDCVACHDSHGTGLNSLIFKEGEALCYDCHTDPAIAATQTNTPGPDVETQFFYGDRTHRHDIKPEDQVGPDGIAGTADDTKIECINCHNVHMATADSPITIPEYPWANLTLTELHGRNEYSRDVVLGFGGNETVYFCYGCHDGVTPSGLDPLPDIKNAPNISPWWGKAEQEYTADAIPKPIPDGGHRFINESVSSYPGLPDRDNPQKVPCVECHEHHGSKNVHLLRDEIANGFDTTSSSETTRSFCLNCHNGTRVIGGITVLPPPTGEIDLVYGSDSPDGDDFVRQHDSSDPVYGQWSCLKCHNPHNPLPDYEFFQNTTILDTTTNPNQMHAKTSNCLSCHKEGTGNPFPRLNAQMFDTGPTYKSRHDIAYDTTGGDCAKCHERDHNLHGINYDEHNANRGYQSIVRDPDRSNGQGVDGSYVPDNDVNYKTSTVYCLECHRGQYYGNHNHKQEEPNYGSLVDPPYNPPTFNGVAPPNIARDWFGGGHGQFTYSGAGLDPVGDSDQVVCFDCHEYHASEIGTKLVKKIDGNVVNNDKTMCYACHRTAGVGGDMWPGADVYDSSYHDIGHSGAGIPIENQGAWDSTAAHLPIAGSCQNCHNPHGVGMVVDPAATGDARYDTTGDGLAEEFYPDMLSGWEEEVCFKCHDGSTAINIKQYFDSTVSYSAHWITDWQQVGPDGVKGTPDDAKVECTDCHNPHIMKDDKVVKWPGHPLENRSAWDDDFCLACHAADTDGDGIPDNIPSTVKFPFVDENNDGYNDRIWPKDKVFNAAQRNYSKRRWPNPSDPGYSPQVYCVECHNPHGGTRKMLIRKYVMGVDVGPVDVNPFPNDPAYSKIYLDLREEDLCFVCHDDENAPTADSFNTTGFEPGDPEYEKDFNITYYDSSKSENDIKQFYYVETTTDGVYETTRTTSHHNVFYDEQVGADGRPGVAGVDDDGNGFIDDEHEIGYVDSDDNWGLDGVQGTADDGGGAVECEDCHDHHTAQYTNASNGEYPTTDPFPPHNPMPGDQEFCLRCHDNNPPDRVKGLKDGLKKNIMVSYNPNGNTYFDSKYPAKPLPQIEKYEGHHLQSDGTPLVCMNCHNQHGSQYMKQLRDNTFPGAPGGYDATSRIQNMREIDLVFNDNGTPDPYDDSGDVDEDPQSNAAERCLTCHSGGTTVSDNPTAVTNLIPLPVPPQVSWAEYFNGDTKVHILNRHPVYPSGLVGVLTALNAGGQKGTTKSVYAWTQVFDSTTYVPQICTDCHDSHNPYVKSTDAGEVIYCFQCHNANSGIPDIQTEFNMTPGKEDWANSIHPINFDPASYETSRNLNDLECLKCHDQAGNHMSKNIHLVNPPGGQYDTSWTGVGIGELPNGNINDFCLGCHMNPNYASDEALQFTGIDAQGNPGPHLPPQLPLNFLFGAHFDTTTGYGGNNGGVKCTDCHQHHGSKGRKLRQMFNERDAYYDQNWHSDYDTASFGKDYDGDGKFGKDRGVNNGHVAEELQEEAFCLFCHDQTANSVNGLNIAAIFDSSNPGARHAVFDVDQTGDNLVDEANDQPTDDARIECENCHNPHVVARTAPVTNPYTPSASQVAIPANQDFCINCHGNSVPPGVKFPGYPEGQGAPEWNGLEWNKWNKSFFVNTAHANNSTKNLVCADCHDPHGGGNYRTLRTSVDSPFDSTTYTVTGITYGERFTVPIGTRRFEPINENQFCFACHLGPLGVYPGKAAWESRDFGNQTSPTSGDKGKDKNCTYCHNPHGSEQAGIKLLRHTKPLYLDGEDENNPGHANPDYGNLVSEEAYNSGIGTDLQAVGNVFCLSDGCHAPPFKNPDPAKMYKSSWTSPRYDSFDIDKDSHLTRETYGRDSAVTYGNGTSSHHPIEEGVIDCWDCHDPHGSENDPVFNPTSKNDDPSLKAPYYRAENWPAFYRSADGNGYAYNNGTLFGYDNPWRNSVQGPVPPAEANDLCFMCHRREDIIGPEGAPELTPDNSNTNFKGHEVVYGGAMYSRNLAGGGPDGKSGNNAIQQDFHKFTCSMCHWPHATRREKLLKTNCYIRNFNSPLTMQGGKRNFYNNRPGRYMQSYCHPYESTWAMVPGVHRGYGWYGKSYMGWRVQRMSKTDFQRPPNAVDDLKIISYASGNIGEETLPGFGQADITGYTTVNGSHSQNDVLLQWTAVEDIIPSSGVDHYNVYINDAEITLANKDSSVRLLERVAEGSIAPGNIINYWMPYGHVNDSTTYYYAVVAADSEDNESLISNSVGELMDVADTTPPPPAVIQATQLGGTYFAQLQWDDPGDNGDIVAYDVYRAPDVSGTPGAYALQGTQADTDRETKFLTDTRASSGPGPEYFTQAYDATNNGDIYWYRVVSRDSATLESTSNEVSMLITDPVPEQITTLVIIDQITRIAGYPKFETGTTKALLEWVIPQDGDFDGSTITKYHVYRYYETFAAKDPAKLVISAVYDTSTSEYKFSYDSTDYYTTTIPETSHSYNDCGATSGDPGANALVIQGTADQTWGVTPETSVRLSGSSDSPPYTVIYQINNLDPDKLYYLKVTYYKEGLARTQTLELDDDGNTPVDELLIHGPLSLPDSAKQVYTYAIPTAAYQDSTIQLNFKGATPNAVVSEVDVVERGKVRIWDMIPKDAVIRESAYVRSDLTSYYYYYGVTAEDDAVPSPQEGALSNVVNAELPRSVSNLQATLEPGSQISLVFDQLPQQNHPTMSYGDFAIAQYVRHKRGTLDDITGFSTSVPSTDVTEWDSTTLTDSLRNLEPGVWEFAVFTQYTDGLAAPPTFKITGRVLYDGALGDATHKYVFVVLADPLATNEIYYSTAIPDYNGSETSYLIDNVLPRDYDVFAYIDMDGSAGGQITDMTSGDIYGMYSGNTITVDTADWANVDINITLTN